MSHSIEPQVADHRALYGVVLVMNHSEDDTTGVSSRDKKELGLKLREAFRHAWEALEGGRTALHLLRKTRLASEGQSLDSIWINRKDLGSKLQSYVFLQSIDPLVNKVIEDANAHHGSVFGIDREMTSSVLEASSWVGQWGAYLLETVSELIYLREDFSEACQMLNQFIPIGGIENLEETIGRLRESIIRAEKAANVPSQQADGGDRDGVTSDGLYRSDALFVWNGKRYEWLTPTMMDVLELLCKCYPDAVKPSAIENKIGAIPEGGFKKVFRVNRKNQTGLHEVVSIISGRAPKGWCLIK